MILTEDEWFALKDFFVAQDGKTEAFEFELPFDWLANAICFNASGRIVKSFTVGGVTTYKEFPAMSDTDQPTRLKVRFDTENLEAFQIVKQADPDIHPFMGSTQTYYRVSPIALIEVLACTDITYTATDFGTIATPFTYPILPVNSSGDRITVQVESSDSKQEGRTKRGEKELLKYNGTVLYLEEFQEVLGYFLAAKGRLLPHSDGFRFDADTLSFTQLQEDIFQVDSLDLLLPPGLEENPSLIFSTTSTFSQNFNYPPNGTYTFTIEAPNSLNTYPASNIKAYLTSADWDDAATLGEWSRDVLGSFSGSESIGKGKKSYTAVVQQLALGPCYFSGTIQWEVYSGPVDAIDPVFPYCTIVKIVRRDGTVEGFSSWGANLEIDDVTYRGNTAINPTAINKKSGVSTDNLEFRSFLSDDNISNFAIEAGLYEEADVTLYIANIHSLATEIVFSGFIGEITKTDSYFIFELQSRTTLLERAISKKTATRCHYNFCDSYCGLNIDDFKTTRTVSHLSSARTLTVLGDGIGEDFEEGYFEFTTGILTGARFDIKESTGGQDVQTYRVIPSGFEGGTDEITLYKGCKKSPSHCKAYGNFANFGGFLSGGNWMPGPDIYMS